MKNLATSAQKTLKFLGLASLSSYKPKSWRRASAITIALAAVVFALTYKLGSLTNGLSPQEANFAASVTFANLVQNPLALPLKLPLALINYVSSHPGAGLVRLPSAIFGLLTLAAAAKVMHKWYGLKPMLYGVALFGLSSWLLHVSRVASLDIVYLWALPTLLASVIYLEMSVAKPLVFLASAFGLGLVLYVPGVIWLAALVILWRRKQLWQVFKRLSLVSWLGFVAVFLATQGLLIAGFIQNPNLALTWLGLPSNLASASTITGDFGRVFAHIFVIGKQQPLLWLGKLPILSIFTSIMFAIGAYFYGRRWQAPRSQLLLALLLISAALVALGGAVRLSLVVPIIFLVAAAGAGYLLRVWLVIFPRNPLARRAGVLLVALVISLACVYNLEAYFVAWANKPATKSLFSSSARLR